MVSIEQWLKLWTICNAKLRYRLNSHADESADSVNPANWNRSSSESSEFGIQWVRIEAKHNLYESKMTSVGVGPVQFSAQAKKLQVGSASVQLNQLNGFHWIGAAWGTVSIESRSKHVWLQLPPIFNQKQTNFQSADGFQPNSALHNKIYWIYQLDKSS